MGVSHHSAIIKDKTLFVCGHNQFGQLGLGFNTSSSPYIGANVFTQLDGEWKMVACGTYHTLAIKKDRTLWAWGYNYYGQLGLSDTNNRNVPTQVGTDRWKMVSCGYNHTLAIKEDGTLWAWGLNSNGRLGLGDTTHRNVPTRVSTNIWKIVACGSGHTLAIKEDGTLWAWGYNDRGQLGLGNTTDRNVPTQIIGFENVDSLMNYYYYSMYVFCYLIKSLDKIQTFLDHEWIDLNITAPTQQDFETYGMESLTLMITPTTIARKTMDDYGALGEGKLFRKTIDVSKFGRIEDIKFY